MQCITVAMLLAFLIPASGNSASAAEAVGPTNVGQPAVDSAQSAADLGIDPEQFPVGSAGRDLAVRSVDFDFYRATDSEVNALNASIKELIVVHEDRASTLQPTIKDVVQLEAAEQQKRDELQRSVDDLSTKLSGLAIQNFRSANRAFAAMSIEATESTEVETLRRTAQTLELVTDDSTDDYSLVAAKLQTVIDRQTELAGKRVELEREQQDRQQQFIAAEKLGDVFTVLAETRTQRITQRSNAAIAAERSDTPLAVVGPITVNQNIAGAVEALLADAAEDGIIFGGWGQRPVSRQIELRRSHCGSSEWAIFDKSSGRCGPPTARPGKSQHELGLAIDFTENGSVLTRSSPGFAWMKANAARYGLKNLPSEPWHWSTTGN